MVAYSRTDLGDAQTFALTASQFTDMSRLAEALLQAVTPFGMTAAASGLVSGPKVASPDQFHFAHWPADWVAHYMAEEYYLVDPVPRWARSSGRPITWRDLFQLLPARDPGRKAIAAAARFGFTEGMIVPMRSADNSLGVVSFGGERDFLSQSEQIALTIIAEAAFRSADRIVSDGAGRIAPLLSNREIECVRLMAQGHADAQIAKLAGLSVRTVRFHLAAAREKLGAGTRIHLAALAIAQGFIGP